jgi:hypothetical protein
MAKTNPKKDRQSPADAKKDPADRGPSYDLMTDAQASDLRTLAEQAHELDAFSSGLSKAEAARRIDALRAKLELQDEPPHTL